MNRYYATLKEPVRGGEELYHMLIGGNTQAEDGMQLERSAEFTATMRTFPRNSTTRAAQRLGPR